MMSQEIYSYQGIFEQIQSPYSNTLEHSSLTTRMLAFDPQSKVIVGNSTILGIRKIRVLREEGKTSMKVMIAYQKATARLLWWEPITKGLLGYEITPIGLMTMHAYKQTITFLDPLTGHKLNEILLPEQMLSPFDKFHITPKGTCYFITRVGRARTLFIGVINEGAFVTLSVKKTPPGFIHFYEEYVCFKFEENKYQYVIDKTGKEYSFTHCKDIKIQNNTLFKVVKEPLIPDRLFFTTQRIAKGSLFKLKEPIESFLIPPCTDHQTLDFLGKNLCVSHLKKDHKHLLAIIDIKMATIRVLQEFNPFQSHLLTDQKTKSVWCLTEDRTLRKHTKKKSVVAGKIENYDKVRLIEVDKEGCLYCLLKKE